MVNVFLVYVIVVGFSYVGEKSVILDCGYGIGIGGGRGVRGYFEEVIFRVDGSELFC